MGLEKLRLKGSMRWGVILLLALTWAKPVLPGELTMLPAKAHAEWQAVGRINVAGYRKREMCTGVLVAPDKVLTAAHCVSGVDGIGPKPEEFTFVAGWLQGAAADAVSASSIWVHPEAYAEGALNIRYDIAILSLERDASVVPLAIAPDSSTAPFGVVGYSVKRPHMLSAAFDCLGASASGLLRLDCAVLPGNSGGPVLTRTGDEWAVAAIVSAMGQTGALAVPVSRLPNH